MNKFRFLLINKTTSEIKEDFSEARTFNEAISDAYVLCHTLRGTENHTWEIISATNERYRKGSPSDTNNYNVGF